MTDRDRTAATTESTPPAPKTLGRLIVNADDWGRDQQNTDRTLECVLKGTVSSASAMVFMDDSERAAGIARDRAVDCGLHLNLTTPFDRGSELLAEHQRKVTRFLRSHRYAPALPHPGLQNSFEYVFRAQWDEFQRVYGAEPKRVDGHHHMHLCASVLMSGLIPPGTVVRRNFTFADSEKGALNRLYRGFIDRKLAKRYRITDFFYSIEPVENIDRLRKIVALASEHVVELETHPVNEEEYRFLSSGELLRYTAGIEIASKYDVDRREQRTGLTKH